jgi:glycosyltransferase involved in cell wall biosynthesis
MGAPSSSHLRAVEGGLSHESRPKTLRARLSEPVCVAERPASRSEALASLGIPAQVQFHVLSFEGPDAYARIGGLETRVSGLCQALTEAGHDTHLWFVGAAEAPAHERRQGVSLHRWCQWISRYHPVGVYDGEHAKVPDYASSLPPYLLAEHLRPHLLAGGHAVVMAEEWQTVDAVLHLDALLQRAGLRERVRILWNANNVFGFEQIDWAKLRKAAVITTVSRYMKHLMHGFGVEAVAIPNGLGADAYLPPDRGEVAYLRRRFAGRTALTKMARWDPDKRWLGSVEIVARLRALGAKPLLVARGGREVYGGEVLSAMRAAGLRVIDRAHAVGDLRGLAHALDNVGDADVVNLTSHVDPIARRVLFRASDVVLANSSHEPFGLVGLEAMAVGGIACTGSTGEDYAQPGHNALVLQTSDPDELIAQLSQLRSDRALEEALRRAGRSTARRFAWPEVIRTGLAPRLSLPGSPRAC